ncbi:hypothetical protein SAMN05216241_11110 [Limimonas halophila]|uniref:Uncharacterized protein n=1 Tax=Limimonas halophila TaxID=1082479 RepID=A0A1G7U0D7_9PROT|nr:hypothetical protein [Limimonas halophila]SDG40529.1 hypothetical protein SAMN05216241_11110 [Limimonas halophila]
MRLKHTIASAAALALMASPAAAAETPITVHVISQGAKFIGSSMGGVQITLENARTGEVLDTGVTSGGTGDTDRIMRTAHKRGAQLSTEGAAQYSTTLDLQDPTKIRVTAHGPLAQEQSANTVSATQWVVPGKGITAGDAWRLTMPGFVVDVLEPGAHAEMKGTPATVTLHANVRMMCGCPITPGGTWDAERYEVAAILKRGGEKLREVPLKYDGSASQFAADVKLETPGGYSATVYAYDPKSGMTGLDRTTFAIEP